MTDASLYIRHKKNAILKTEKVFSSSASLVLSFYLSFFLSPVIKRTEPPSQKKQYYFLFFPDSLHFSSRILKIKGRLC